jgi:hypothetical protein
MPISKEKREPVHYSNLVTFSHDLNLLCHFFWREQYYMNENQIKSLDRIEGVGFSPPSDPSINESLKEIETKLDALAKEFNSLDDKFITNKKFEELVGIVAKLKMVVDALSSAERMLFV